MPDRGQMQTQEEARILQIAGADMVTSYARPRCFLQPIPGPARVLFVLLCKGSLIDQALKIIAKRNAGRVMASTVAAWLLTAANSILNVGLRRPRNSTC